jgi:hypothetical protein
MKLSSIDNINIHNLESYGLVSYDVTTPYGIIYSKIIKRNIGILSNNDAEVLEMIPLPIHLRELYGIKFFAYDRRGPFNAYPSKIYIKAKNARKLNVILAFLSRDHIRKAKSKRKTVNLLDFVDNFYINDDTKEVIKNHIQKFVNIIMFSRRIRTYNKSMSVIFRGDPGDGKSHTANSLCANLSGLLNLPVAVDSITTFGKAANSTKDFISLIDDVTIAHMNRTTCPELCSKMLSEMDSPNCSRLFVLTTNEAFTKENVDPAFFRNGRVEAIIDFKKPEPNVKSRFLKDFLDSISSINIKEFDKSLITPDVYAGVKYFSEEMTDDMSFAELVSFRNNILGEILNDNTIDLRKCLEFAKNIELEEVVHHDL